MFVAIRYSQERSELRPSKRRQPAPGAQQRLLQRVLGVVDRAEHPVAVRVQLPAVGLDEPREGGLVAAAGRVRSSASVRVATLSRGAISARIRPDRLPGRADEFAPRPGLRLEQAHDESHPHPVVHLELHTGDLARARALYAELCGWPAESIGIRQGA